LKDRFLGKRIRKPQAKERSSNRIEMKDVLGEALSDYFHKTSTGKLWVNNKYGPREEMPVGVYFREAGDMPELEWIALQQCRGKVLDIGAGAGSHALILQQMGLDITALDISPKAATVMGLRGVKEILRQDYFALEPVPPGAGSYDTLLLLMNGIGLAGTLDGLRNFLAKARSLLRPGGQLLFDSSDIAYMYDGKTPQTPDYYGEILYQYEYRKQKSDWFKWLFIDRTTLSIIAVSEGWYTEVLFGDKWDQYLVKCQVAG
jgi:2-polyprenyl-3-methyl-5-hydroxy-6-metoxy-1,4-benzoquinol methylase